MFAALLIRIKGYAAAAIGAALFLAFVFLKGRQDGKNAAELAQAKKQAEAIKRKKASDEQVDGMSPDDRRDELSKWMRDR
ncbi:hypothetical protein [Ensifer adhaerens]|uniref:hypothetical protein n=1 Tax=Ensifer adhaerens TaxID=106592 RepID=UPI000CF15066|nr:hypothetical protein [Ensifer adhaerens]